MLATAPARMASNRAGGTHDGPQQANAQSGSVGNGTGGLLGPRRFTAGRGGGGGRDSAPLHAGEHRRWRYLPQ